MCESFSNRRDTLRAAVHTRAGVQSRAEFLERFARSSGFAQLPGLVSELRGLLHAHRPAAAALDRLCAARPRAAVPLVRAGG